MKKIDTANITVPTAQVKNGALILRITLDTLVDAVHEGEYNNEFDGKKFNRLCTVTQPVAFAKAVGRMLMEQDEDGSTPFTRMLDTTCEMLLESGELDAGFEDNDE